MNLSENDSTNFYTLNEQSFNTKYFTENDISLKSNSDKDFSILSVNIRSIQKNFETFKEFYKNLNFLFDIICLTETWEDPKTPLAKNSLYDLPCYEIVSQPRIEKKRRWHRNLYPQISYI